MRLIVCPRFSGTAIYPSGSGTKFCPSTETLCPSVERNQTSLDSGMLTLGIEIRNASCPAEGNHVGSPLSVGMNAIAPPVAPPNRIRVSPPPSVQRFDPPPRRQQRGEPRRQ